MDEDEIVAFPDNTNEVSQKIEAKPVKNNSSKRKNKKKDDIKSAESDRELQAIQMVKKYKEPAEANLIGCFYKNPELLLDCKLDSSDFTYNHWRVYYVIVQDLYREIKTPTEDNIEFYLNQHPQLAQQYRNNKGYQTIEKLLSVVKIEDFEGYLEEVRKWNAILKIAGRGFPIKDYLSDFADKSAEEVYDKYTAYLNDAFINIESQVKTYNGFEGLHTFNEECDKGVGRGLDFCAYDPTVAQYLNNETTGFHIDGHIYGLGGNSGVGKSTVAINYILPTVLATHERAVFIINEEDEKKFKREAETWVINNIILKNSKKRFNKRRFREGSFTPEEKQWLFDAANFLESLKDQHLITVVPLERYTVNLAIKVIRKYARLFKVKIFVLDTFKESCDSYNVETWKSMERDMRALYDTIKEASLKVGLFVTYQLNKNSVKTRYLTSADIGQAKNIEDVMSVNLMIRKVHSDELKDGNRAIKFSKIYDGPGSGSRSSNMDLDPDRNYMLIFICKNRFGSSDPYQIVVDCDLGANVLREIGITHVIQDF